MEFKLYQEKPIIPKKVQVHQFKKSESEGLCFCSSTWTNNNWRYSGDYTPEEFERLRKVFGIKKSELHNYVTINGVRIRISHNSWIVLDEKGKPMRVMSTERLKETYDIVPRGDV